MTAFPRLGPRHPWVAGGLVLLLAGLVALAWLVPGGRDVGAGPEPPVVSPDVALDCVERPSDCGFPDASNTGVGAGVRLRAVPTEISSGPGWHVDERGWLSVDQDGAVLENLVVPFTVDITASNVTVRNVRITVGGETFGIALRHTHGVTIEDTEIGPPEGATRLMVGIKDIYGDSTGTSVLRSEITRASTGVQIYSGLIQGCYIHTLDMEPGDHVNGVTSNGSMELLRIENNTILNRFDQTDAVGLFQDFGVEANRAIRGNLLAGGGYAIYAGANPDGQPTHGIQVVGNRIARLYFDRGGSHGPVAAFDPDGVDNVWAGNIWDDTGEEIPVPSLDASPRAGAGDESVREDPAPAP